MASIKITPDKNKKRPYSVADTQTKTFVEELQVAADTAEMLESLGAPIELSPGDEIRQTRLIEDAIKHKKTANLANINTAYAASAFLKAYGQRLAFDAVQARSAITSKLMEIANCGDTKFELRALELLGKHSDIGLFTERSEITINYKTPEALENAIKERVKRLLNADILDITSLGADLDAELGIVDVFEGEYVVVEGGTDEDAKTQA